MEAINAALLQSRLPAKPVTKRVTQEFQLYGLDIATKLDDQKHKGIYIRMAKNYPRNILDAALTFVSDSNARNKGALFMWKVKQLRNIK